VAAFRRLRHLDTLQRRAAEVVAGRRADDDRLLDELGALYRGRRDLAEGLRSFEQGAARVGDTESQLGVFEARVIRAADDQAARVIGQSVRRSGAAAAISPFPALDIAVSFYINLRLMRQVAELYGGRPGWAATVRLLQIAFTNVLAAGAIDTLEDTFSDLLGGGVATKVSSKMGAAVVNGLLTARLGLAAADACRPVPWTVCARPRARELARRALIDRLRPQGAAAS
jgi:putative membrane protein